MIIENSESHKTFKGTNKKDSIKNFGSFVKIFAKGDNDTVENNSGSHVTINADSGNDLINNSWGGNLIINCGNGNDSVETYWGKNITILGGAGNDSVNNSWGENTIINSGKGNNYVDSNWGKNITISGSSGNDSLYNSWGENVIINGGNGNDFLETFRGENITVNGGNGEDSISNGGKNVTILGGQGNDFISLDKYGKNSVIQYKTGDGNDKILGFNSDDTLQINEGSYSTIKSGKDFIIKVGKNSIRFKNALAESYNKITVKDSKGNFKIFNDWKKWTGSINNFSSNVTLAGSKKNDTITNYADNVFINGGIGKDSITNEGENITINGGAGNDSISNSGENVTISGGKGNDLTSFDSYGKNSVIQYKTGDGNDTIFGFHSSDTLHITEGNYEVKTNGEDIIVTVGKGKIILKDARDQQISIKNSKGKVSMKNYSLTSSALFEENNFVSSDNLFEITENNLTPTSLEKISEMNFKNLTHENNFITCRPKLNCKYPACLI